MRMCRRLALCSGGGAFGEDAFSYTGECLFFAEDNGNWRLKLLTSGVLTLLRKTKVDIFAVGGGGGGGNGNDGSYGGQGGGGGFTATVKAKSLAKNVSYTVTIGAGGAAHTPGGASSFGELCTAQGGEYGANGGDGGGYGGSGGGVPGSTANTWAKRAGGAGGKYKENGIAGETNTGSGGGGGGGHNAGGAGGSGIVILRSAR